MSRAATSCLASAPSTPGRAKVEDKSESLVLLHTRKALVPQVIECIIQEHPYDKPQVLAMPITDANPAYRDWLVAETSRDRS